MADLFFYGTLLDTDIFEGISGLNLSDVKTSKAIRMGFACEGMANWPYPMLVEKQGAELTGLIFHDIQDPALSRIKFYEGDEYELVEVDVHVDGKPAKARVFEGGAAQTSSGLNWSLANWQMSEKAKTMKIINLMMPKFTTLSYDDFNRQWDALEEEL
ncbi:MAG: gamma-glutamylcyclotransferase family protein [Alphaproteobacteria bacterium]